MNFCASLSATCIVAIAVMLPSPTLAQTNLRIGTWKLNLPQSSFSPGPAFRDESQIAEMIGDAVKVTVEITDATARKLVQGYTAKYDGKSYPFPGSPWETIALTLLDAYTSKAVFHRGGKAVQTTILTVSPDGKQLTIMATGTTPDGQPLNNREVFDRQ